jgi:hypothetical protein
VGHGPKVLPMPLPISVVLIIPGNRFRPRHSGQRRRWPGKEAGRGLERPSGVRSGTRSRVGAGGSECRLHLRMLVLGIPLGTAG